MTFSLAVKSAFRNYANFHGRARRSEFWYFVLFQLILFAVAVAFEMIHTGLGSVLYSLLVLALLLPNLAIAVRRLHDTGRSGWWILLDFVPAVGPLVLLIWYCGPSTPGPNRFDPDFKGSTVANVTI